MNKKILKLCLVTHKLQQTTANYHEFILTAIAGGVTCVQLREKNKSLQEIEIIARDLMNILKPRQIPLIINDHVEIAKIVDADGVHVGQSDWSPMAARELLGADKIIGWSVESLADVDAANRLDCINYIGASAVFPSSTKTNCKTIWGIEGLKQIVALSTHPVVAIGGINQSNAARVFAAGAAGIAVISAIHDAEDVYQASQLLSEQHDVHH